LLFINCETEEQKYGTSYTNEQEAKIVVDLVKHLTSWGVSYEKKKFGFVSPYQGQVQKLKESLSVLELQDNVRTIDSW
jgi:superfamily I DNA and/or RNA helicase